MKTIAERVKHLRLKKGLTQAELDKIADLSSGHVGAIERGRREAPNTTTMLKLARALSVDVGWLIWGGKATKIRKTG